MQQNSERENQRADLRYPAAAVPGIIGVRLSPGDVVTLVNISNSGILVEGKTRFVPATRVAVVFEGPAALGSVSGRIVRCQVSAVGGGKLRYQSAIAFENKIDLRLEEPAPSAAAPSVAPSTGNPVREPVPATPSAGVYNRW
jgi:hypothetical protein